MRTLRLSIDERLAVYNGRQLVFVMYVHYPYAPSSCAMCICAEAPGQCLPCSRTTRKDRASGYWKEQT